jgi:hypothetical protein
MLLDQFPIRATFYRIVRHAKILVSGVVDS